MTHVNSEPKLGTGASTRLLLCPTQVSLLAGIINVRLTSKGTLNQVSTIVSGCTSYPLLVWSYIYIYIYISLWHIIEI